VKGEANESKRNEVLATSTRAKTATLIPPHTLPAQPSNPPDQRATPHSQARLDHRLQRGGPRMVMRARRATIPASGRAALTRAARTSRKPQQVQANGRHSNVMNQVHSGAVHFVVAATASVAPPHQRGDIVTTMTCRESVPRCRHRTPHLTVSRPGSTSEVPNRTGVPDLLHETKMPTASLLSTALRQCRRHDQLAREMPLPKIRPI
jgi:hypothetical protein